MKMNKTRPLAAVLGSVLLLSSSLFIGCGSDNVSTSGSTSTTAGAVTTTTKAATTTTGAVTTTTKAATTTTGATTTTTLPSGSGTLKAADMAGSWKYTMSSYFDTKSSNPCAVLSTPQASMVCTAVYDNSCNVSTTCSFDGFTLPATTSKCDPNNATVTTSTDSCNTKYTTSGSLPSLNVTGTVNGSTAFTMTMIKQ